MADRTVQLAAELVHDAEAVAARDSISVREQLERWLRVGRAVCEERSTGQERVVAVLEGRLALNALSETERVLADALLDAVIRETARRVDFGKLLTARGITTVALDDEGRLVEYAPDGTSRVLAEVDARLRPD